MTTMLSPKAATATSPRVQRSNRAIDAPVCEKTATGRDPEEQELASMPSLRLRHPTPFAWLAPLWRSRRCCVTILTREACP